LLIGLSIHEHSFKFENGYSVCVDCGEVDKEPSAQIKSLTAFPKEIIYTPKFNPKGRWNWLFRLNKQTSRITYKAQRPIFERLLNQLDLNRSQRAFLRHTYAGQKPTTYKGIYGLVFDTVLTYNYPVTTFELYKTIKNMKFENEFRRTYGYPYRDYSWLIYRLLNRIGFMSDIEKDLYYLKILNVFKKVKHGVSSADVNLIKCLTWKFIDNNYQGHALIYKDFDISSTTINNVKRQLRGVGVKI